MSVINEDKEPLITSDAEPDVKREETTLEMSNRHANDTESVSSSESEPLVSHKRTGRSRCFYISKKIGKWMLKNLLLILTVASVIAGTIIGVCVREVDLPKESNDYLVMVELLSFPGEIFLRMLKMLILPLIVFSLIAGLGSLEGRVAGSLGWKTILYYFSTTVMTIVLGLVLVVTIQPGGRVDILECDNSTHGAGHEIELVDTILDLIRNMLPDNLFTATFRQDETRYVYENVTNYIHCLQNNLNFSELNDTSSCKIIRDYITDYNLTCANSTNQIRHITVAPREGMNILGIIVFTVAFAIVLSRQGPGGRQIVEAIGVLNNAIMNLVSLVMWYSPIGIASIIAGKLAEVDDFGNLIAEIGLYVVTVMIGLLIHACITLPLLYTIMTRSNPLKVVKAVLQALLTAFGTSSSSATLPVTIQNLEDNFNADSRVTRFMLPVGATINMDGTALYEAVAAVFIAQVEGVALTFDRIIIINITATLASVGAAGVPQAGLFTLVIVLVAVGLDPENVALILAVDWMLDRFRTVTNVLGDSFGVGIVQHYSRKQLDKVLPTSTSADNQSEDNKRSTESSPVNKGQNGVVGYGSSSPSPSLEDLPKETSPLWSGLSQSNEGSPQVYMAEPVKVHSGGEAERTPNTIQDKQESVANEETTV